MPNRVRHDVHILHMSWTLYNIWSKVEFFTKKCVIIGLVLSCDASWPANLFLDCRVYLQPSLKQARQWHAFINSKLNIYIFQVFFLHEKKCGDWACRNHLIFVGQSMVALHRISCKKRGLSKKFVVCGHWACRNDLVHYIWWFRQAQPPQLKLIGLSHDGWVPTYIIFLKNHNPHQNPQKKVETCALLG